jgi:hypothetical protein
MRFAFVCAALISTLSVSTIAAAQDPAPAASSSEIKRNAWIFSSDSKRIGRIDYIGKGKDGTPSYAAVIYDSRIVHIPLSTLSPKDKGYTTTLSVADVSKLK